ncbi:MAG: hypothetical protein WDZ77_03310 [Candidatus Pacearchaeota archaeon]
MDDRNFTDLIYGNPKDFLKFKCTNAKVPLEYCAGSICDYFQGCFGTTTDDVGEISGAILEVIKEVPKTRTTSIPDDEFLKNLSYLHRHNIE